MKRKIRFFAAALAFVLALAPLPTAAFAAGESEIQFGSGAIGQGDVIYFGEFWNRTATSGAKYKTPWIMLDTSGLFISKYTLGSSQFNGTGTNNYSGSALDNYMGGIRTGSFTAMESTAIKDTWLDDISDSRKLYALSFAEDDTYFGFAEHKALPITDTTSILPSEWWLRTAYVDGTNAYAGGEAIPASRAQSTTLAVRPVFNLDMSYILFISPAAGGKASGPVGVAGLQGVSASAVSEYKLTLHDSARDGFTAALNSASSSTVAAGSGIKIDYSGAQTGAKEYVSAMLVDAGNNVLCYGRLANNSASGTGMSINIPSWLSAGSYTLKVFSEQYNGDYLTDYAGDFSDIALTVTVPAAAEQIELRTTTTHIQWKYVSGNDTTWTNLVALSEITGADGADGMDGAAGTNGAAGREIELRSDTTSGYIQWRYSGDTGWNNLTALSVLQGEKGDTGAAGTNGADGLTPFIAANGNWKIGDTDTGVKAAGTNGIDVTDGLTPFINASGNWQIGNTDTGVAAGTDGRNGIDGANGINGINGRNGANGINGKDGVDGKDGVGVASAQINDSGELIIVLTDGREINAGSVRDSSGAADNIGKANKDWAARGYCGCLAFG